MFTDKSVILNRIKVSLGFIKDSDFARFLGIKPQTLSGWHSRNTFDTELIYAKCNHIDANWLITGQGSMLKSIESSIIADKNLTANKPNEKYDSEYWKNRYIEVQDKYTALLENRLYGDKSPKAG